MHWGADTTKQSSAQALQAAAHDPVRQASRRQQPISSCLSERQSQLLSAHCRPPTLAPLLIAEISCWLPQNPVDRAISYMIASNLYTDSEELLRNLHMAPYLKPVVSLIDDFPQQQRHKGWQFGYATAKNGYDTARPTLLTCWGSA